MILRAASKEAKQTSKAVRASLVAIAVGLPALSEPIVQVLMPCMRRRKSWCFGEQSKQGERGQRGASTVVVQS
jgi:hypothetical protein